MTLLWSLLAFCLAMLLVIGVAVVILNVTLRTLVHRRHQELEEVANGRLPKAWTSGVWSPGPLGRWRCRRRLRILTRDVERSTLVEDEETRDYLLQRLKSARSTVGGLSALEPARETVNDVLLQQEVDDQDRQNR